MVLHDSTTEVLARINAYKREINYLRKSIPPTKGVILHHGRLDSDLIYKQTTPFLKNLLDLAAQTVEIIDSCHDMLFDHLKIYYTGIGNRLNEIMKILNTFSAIFFPLTLIAGIYGSNFNWFAVMRRKKFTIKAREIPCSEMYWS